MEETGVTTASKADRIASATRRTITENMEENPAFYKQFSEMLEETIRDYRERRLSEKEYLSSVVDIASRVSEKDHGRDIPETIRGNDDVAAFFGVIEPAIVQSADSGRRDDAAQIALALIDIVKSHHIVDVWSNDVAKNKMRDAIDDYFFDVVRDGEGIQIPVEQLDELETKIINLARARFPA